MHCFTIQELTQSDDDINLGHLGLALTGYCQVAALFVRGRNRDQSLGSVGGVSACQRTPLQAADEIFHGTSVRRERVAYANCIMDAHKHSFTH